MWIKTARGGWRKDNPKAEAVEAQRATKLVAEVARLERELAEAKAEIDRMDHGWIHEAELARDYRHAGAALVEAGQALPYAADERWYRFQAALADWRAVDSAGSRK
jgi:hypothetical protein